MSGRRDALPFSNDLRKALGLNVRRYRTQLGISQYELGFRAEIHPAAVSPLERGESRPQIDSFIRLAGALGVEPTDLVAGILWTPPERRVVAPGAFEVEADPELEAAVGALRKRRGP